MLDMQTVKELNITEGDVRTIHDKDSRLIWSRLAYDTKYAGDTYQQTYTGKNLFNYQGVINMALSGYNFLSGSSFRGYYIKVTAGQTYAISRANTTGNNRFQVCFSIDEPANGVAFYGRNGEAGGLVNYNDDLTGAVTVPSGMEYLFIYLSNSNQTITEDLHIQLELGQTATSYEPFVGGTASPSPDYPQLINVVTGEQTVTISDGVNSETFSVSLGSIELCKMGDYQDYIYKSGDDWYVHKATGKAMFDGTENWTYDSTIPRIYLSAVVLSDLDISAVFPNSSNDLPSGFTNRFIGKTFTNFYSNSQSNGFAMSSVGRNFQVGYKKWQSESDAKSSVNGLVWFYALATPTDTKITDTTLISQLDAIHEWMTRYGYNATVSGNLPIIIDKTNLT